MLNAPAAALAQDGPKWSAGLNAASGTDALGTSNYFPLIIKTNGSERVRVQPDGGLFIKGAAHYDGNYTGTFTLRSLVDKGYVDSTIASLPAPVMPPLSAVLMSGRKADGIGLLQDNNNVQTMNLNQRRLYNSQGQVKVDWEQGLLYNALPLGNVVSLRWIQRELVGFDGVVPSLNWGARWLFNDAGQKTLDWQSRQLTQGKWEYDADYSASYTARSLVDKAYIDARIASLPPPPLPISVFSPGAGQYSAMNNQSGTNNAQAPSSFIGAGQSNIIYPNALYGAIITGTGNRIENFIGPQPIHNLIGSGSNNVIQHDASYAVILSGSNNIVNDGYSLVLGGQGNVIETGNVQNSFNVIHNGVNNRIRSGAGQSAIVSGFNNTIGNNALYSVILSGGNNRVADNVINAIILGGNSVVASQSNTVYVPNLRITGMGIAPGKISVSRITSTDTVLYIGDSSMVFADAYNRMYGNPAGGSYKGTGVGVATFARGNRSIAIGNGVQTGNVFGAISIGSGFINNSPNTLMMGFNSTVPTLVMTPAILPGGTGNIGIGLMAPNPLYKLDIAGGINASQYFVNGAPLIGGQWQVNGNDIYNMNSGRVGIGLSTPQATLHVNGNLRVGTSAGYIEMGYNGFNTILDDYSPNTGLLINTNSHNDVTIGAKLSVCGEIRCKKLRVESGWCDFVFDTAYKLMPLQEVEEFITKNKRLPGYISENEVIETGLDLGNAAYLQQKSIEEIFLYLIALKKENEDLREELKKIQALVFNK